MSHSSSNEQTKSFSHTTYSSPKTKTRSRSNERTPSVTQSNQKSQSFTISRTKSFTQEESATKSESGARTLSFTKSPSRTLSFERTGSKSISRTMPSLSHSLTFEQTSTKSPTIDLTQTFSQSPSRTLSFERTGSKSFTNELTQTFSQSISPSQSISLTQTQSLSPSVTMSLSLTSSATLSYSQSLTNSMSLSTTMTQTLSSSLTQTPSQTLSSSATLTISQSESLSLAIFKRIELVTNFLYAERYQNWTTRRFMIFSAGSLGQDPVVSLQYRARTYMAAIGVQLMHTTTNFDYLDVGQRRCQNYYGKAVSATQCFDWANCDMTHQAFSGGDPVRITAGPKASSTPTCTSNIYLFGAFAIEGFLATRGTYHIAQITGPFATSKWGSDPGLALLLGRVRLTGSAWSASSTPFYQLDKNIQVDDPPEVTVTPSASQWTCDHEEIRSFAPVRGVGIGVQVPCVVTVAGGGTQPCQTQQDYHYQCAISSACVGYSTRLIGLNDQSTTYNDAGSYLEEPFVLHTRTYGYIAEKDIPSLAAYGQRVAAVMYYQKLPPANRTCSFRVEGSQYSLADSARVPGGNSSIYLLQTSYTTSSSKIYVTYPGQPRLLQKECGILQPFIRASDAPSSVSEFTYGVDSQCGTYALCYETGYLPPGTLIEVEAAHDMLQGLCNFSLATYFNYTRSAVAKEVTEASIAKLISSGRNSNVTYAPAINVTGRGYATRELYVPFTDDEVAYVRVYVTNGTFAAMKVVQTGWDCTGRDCPESAIDFSVGLLNGPTTSVVTCGGLAGFSDGASQGSQCDLNLDCTKNVTNMTAVAAKSSVIGAAQTVNATGFTGMAYITVNMTVLKAYTPAFIIPDYCKMFNALLSFTSRTGTSVTDAFPLAIASAFRMNPLLAVRQKTLATKGNTSDAVALSMLRVPSYKTGVSVRSLFSLGPFGDPYDIFVASQSNLTLYPDTQSVLDTMRFHLNPNITFACVGDHLAASTVTCVLPVPIGTNKISISVMQNDYLKNQVSIVVKNGYGATHTSLTRQCGSGSGFQGKAGLKFVCDQFFTCIDTFLDSTSAGSTATGNPTFDFTTVELTFPNSIQPQGCPFSVVALAEFQGVPVVNNTNCSGYVCASDQQCIPTNSVCDGVVNDCSDGADESQCGLYKLLEKGHELTGLKVTGTLRNVSDVFQCRRFAVLQRTTLFNYVNRTCFTIESTEVSTYYNGPSTYLKAVNYSSEVYGVVQYTSSYRRCSRYLHCSSTGELYNAANLKDGDQCTCVCDSTHTGSDCSSLRSMAVVAEYVGVALLNTQASPVAVASALAGGDDSITVNIAAFRPYNDTHMAYPFSFTSFDKSKVLAFQSKMFTATYLAAVNVLMAKLRQNPVLFIMAVDGVSAQASIGRCPTSGSQSFACATLPPSTGVKALSIQTYGVTPPFVIRAVTAPAATSAASGAWRHFDALASSSTTSINITCGGSGTTNLVGTGSQEATCTLNQCMIPFNFTGVLQSFEILTPNSLAIPPVGSDPTVVCQTGRVEIFTIPNITFTEQATGETPTVKHIVVSSFLSAGAALVAIFALFAALGFVVSALWSKSLQRTRRAPALRMHWRATILPEWTRQLLTYLTHTTIYKRYNLQQLAIVVVIFVVTSICVGGAMFVLYQFSQSEEATFGVTVQYFYSRVCEGANVVTLPYKVASFDAFGTKCQSLIVTGLNDGPTYGRALCTVDPVTGGYAMAIAIGASLDDCAAGKLVSVPEDTCISLKSIAAPDFATYATGYFKGSCMNKLTAATVARQYAQVAPSVNYSTVLNTLAPNQAAAINNTVHDPKEEKYSYMVVADGGNEFVTSVKSNRLSSMHKAEDFWGLSIAKRMISQPETTPHNTLFQLAGSYVLNLTTAIEEEARPILGAITEEFHPTTVPHDEDYPVGFIFNEFTTTNQLTGSDTYLGAHRYVGLRGTQFDIGSVYGPSTFEDRKGYTISMWLRVDRTSAGFAFILCDNYEDRTTRESLVVEKLIGIAEDGEISVQSWFDDSFHVYGSLYVQGSDMSLMFMIANPNYLDASSTGASSSTTNTSSTSGTSNTTTASTKVRNPNGGVAKARWDLSTIKQAHLFNGAWHHVAIVLKNQNQQPFAALVVDGHTSTAIGWQQCLTYRPSPIAASTTCVVSDAIGSVRGVCVNGGILYTGYFNGGLRGLQFDGKPVDPSDFIRESTRAIRVRTAQPKNTLNVLAYAILMCLAVLLATGLWHLREARHEAREAQERETKRLRMQWAVKRSVIFCNGAYKYVSFKFAQELLHDVPDMIFSEMMDYFVSQPLEVRPDSRSLGVTAVRVLWLAAHQEQSKKMKTFDDIRSIYPTPQEWEEFVNKQNAQRVKTHEEEEDEMLNSGAEVPEAEFEDTDGDSLGGVAQSFLTTIQSMNVYSTSITLPSGYAATFLPLFQILSFDFFAQVQVSGLVKPIVIFALCCFSLMILGFILAVDQRQFYQMALRYMVRRNKVDNLLRDKTEVMATIVAGIDEENRRVTCPYNWRINVLGRNVRARLHEFSLEPKRPPMSLIDGHDGVFELSHAKGKVQDDDRDEKRNAESTDITYTTATGSAEPKLMPSVYHCCPEHRDVTLTYAPQSTTYPYSGRYECKAVQNGVPCKRRTGPMFVCKESLPYDMWSSRVPVKDTDEDAKRKGDIEADDEYYYSHCNYALCEEHFSASTVTLLSMKLKAKVMKFLKRGAPFLVAKLIVALAFALYTPAMQVAVMIVSCHTFYQCEFPSCWRAVDESFAVTAYVCFMGIALVGVGFPIVLYVLLRQREAAIDDVFTDSRYKGRYLEEDAGHYNMEDAVKWAERSRANRWHARLFRGAKPDTGDEAVVEGTVVPAAAADPTNSTGDAATEPHAQDAPSAAQRTAAAVRMPPPKRNEFGDVLSAFEATLTPPSTPKASADTPALTGTAAAEALGAAPALMAAEGEVAKPGASTGAAPPSGHHKRPVEKVQLSQRFVTSAFVHSSTLSSAQLRQRKHLLEVKPTCWNEFYLSDESLLGKTYQVLRKECITLAPIIMFARFLIVVPALTMEPGLTQLTALTGGIVLFSVWGEIMEPYRSKFIVFIDLAGIAHQLGILGWQAYFLARAHDDEVEKQEETNMFATTIAYIIFVVVVTLVMLLRPAFWSVVRLLQRLIYFGRFALNDFSNVPVYLLPRDNCRERIERALDEETDKTSVRSTTDGGATTQSSESSYEEDLTEEEIDLVDQLNAEFGIDPSIHLQLADNEAIRNARRAAGVQSDSEDDDASVRTFAKSHPFEDLRRETEAQRGTRRQRHRRNMGMDPDQPDDAVETEVPAFPRVDPPVRFTAVATVDRKDRLRRAAMQSDLPPSPALGRVGSRQRLLGAGAAKTSTPSASASTPASLSHAVDSPAFAASGVLAASVGGSTASEPYAAAAAASPLPSARTSETAEADHGHTKAPMHRSTVGWTMSEAQRQRRAAAPFVVVIRNDLDDVEYGSGDVVPILDDDAAATREPFPTQAAPTPPAATAATTKTEKVAADSPAPTSAARKSPTGRKSPSRRTAAGAVGTADGAASPSSPAPLAKKKSAAVAKKGVAPTTSEPSASTAAPPPLPRLAPEEPAQQQAQPPAVASPRKKKSTVKPATVDSAPAAPVAPQPPPPPTVPVLPVEALPVEHGSAAAAATAEEEGPSSSRATGKKKKKTPRSSAARADDSVALSSEASTAFPPAHQHEADAPPQSVEPVTEPNIAAAAPSGGKTPRKVKRASKAPTEAPAAAPAAVSAAAAPETAPLRRALSKQSVTSPSAGASSAPRPASQSSETALSRRSSIGSLGSQHTASGTTPKPPAVPKAKLATAKAAKPATATTKKSSKSTTSEAPPPPPPDQSAE